MTAAELLAECHVRHIDLQAHGDRLDIDGPAGEVTDELLQALRDAKGELLAMLAGGPVPLPGDGPQDLQPSDIDAGEWTERETGDGWVLERADAAGLEIIDVEPCPRCQGIERWQDLLGGWHCEHCEPRTRATWLREHAQRLRERHERNPRR
ncbi:MAG: hypothetical protein GX575_13575 [Candidatus Anammoximicrobium sp.]|nr:hypothetical protein [Candidatus Anammoximicrobium sp.]